MPSPHSSEAERGSRVGWVGSPPRPDAAGAGGRRGAGLSDQKRRPLGQAARLFPACPLAGEARGAQPRASRISSRPLPQQLRTDVLPRGLAGRVSGTLGWFLRGREWAARAPSPPGKGLGSTWPMRSTAGWAHGPEGPRGSGPLLCARPADGGAFFPPPGSPCRRGMMVRFLLQ